MLFVAASYSVVLADAEPSTLLALASYALVLADTKVAELFAAPYVLHYHFTHHCRITAITLHKHPSSSDFTENKTRLKENKVKCNAKNVMLHIPSHTMTTKCPSRTNSKSYEASGQN